jgi:hypothetical protein
MAIDFSGVYSISTNSTKRIACSQTNRANGAHRVTCEKHPDDANAVNASVLLRFDLWVDADDVTGSTIMYCRSAEFSERFLGKWSCTDGDCAIYWSDGSIWNYLGVADWSWKNVTLPQEQTPAPHAEHNSATSYTMTESDKDGSLVWMVLGITVGVVICVYLGEYLRIRECFAHSPPQPSVAQIPVVQGEVVQQPVIAVVVRPEEINPTVTWEGDDNV